MDYRKIVSEMISKASDLEIDKIENMIEVPANSELGDYALPCFKLASIYRKAPVLIAQELAGKILPDSHISNIQAVNGYLNFFVNKEYFSASVLNEILEKKDRYGDDTVGGEQTVIIESSSPNIAKPFHIGHLCSTIIGQSLYRLYESAGYKVVRINHLGDWGTQFGKLISAYKRWGDDQAIQEEPIKELLRIYVKFHEEAEKNPELEEEARRYFKNLEDGSPEETRLWQWFKDLSLKEFNKLYNRLGVSFDSYNGESFYSDKMDEVVSLLEEKSLLKESDQAKIVDLEPYNMPPCIIVKSDGASIYATRDIAAAIYRKRTYDFYKNIYVVGIPQALHFQQFFKVLELMGCEWSKDCVHVGFAHVRFPDKKLSTRSGNVIYLEDVLDESVNRIKEYMTNTKLDEDMIEPTAEKIGIGAVIFAFLKRSREKEMVFSWEETLNLEGESGPYIHYTYARGLNILRKVEGLEDRPDFSLLKEKVEIAIIQKLSVLQETIAEAISRNEPMVIARYVIELSKLFNSFYNSCKVITEEIKLKTARAKLIEACCIVIKKCLYLLGIETVDAM